MPTLIDSDVCAVDDCDRPRRQISNGGRSRYCTGHVSRAQRGDVKACEPLRVHGRFDPTAPISYRGAHHRVRRMRGKATQHRCVDCGERARDWSYNHRGQHEFVAVVIQKSGTYRVTYSGDPADFEPRCRPCHRKHDRIRREEQS